ncbi:hypothetical protein K505DRAFT_326872 [Melanomma pulvis-pyrius CBS 109.77]|uniref:F-box domain-containing protein n=1 Tax=Melanomma pulvis-pyrius CBS 109.77 TaxID=1314802 RepID=A0A6A6X670_9PLEO|nr:hypothetical protein K505DRAFT_326872 [Melanomma pulvis-pyrius CBS 109.77]
MPRSAAQKAARNAARNAARRLPGPTFPLSSLPPELQLLVLCKCDMKSMRRLIRLSPSLRALFLAYPETCLRGTMHHFPHPVGSLVQAAWALHCIDPSDLDPQKATALLQHPSLTEWTMWYTRYDDPIDVLEGLLEMCEDVNDLVQTYAQRVSAAIEMFVNPWVQSAPITLSPTEFARIASTFYMLTIFYQLLLKLPNHPSAAEYFQTFVRNLRPWQVEQGVSIEAFIHSCRYRAGTTVHTLIRHQFSARFKLNKTSSFFQLFWEIMGLDHTVPGGPPICFSEAVRGIRQNLAPSPAVVPWNRHLDPLELQVGPQHPTNQLRNDGWIYFKLVKQNVTIDLQQYRVFFLDLGIFFWDLDRLAEWGFIDPTDFPAIGRKLQRQLRSRLLSSFP